MTSIASDSVPANQEEAFLQPPTSVTDIVARFGSHTVKAAALIGGLSYAVVRLGYESYYTSLGVRPEEVGLDHTTMVTHALVGVVLSLAFVGGVVLLVALPIRTAIDFLRTRSKLDESRIAAEAATRLGAEERPEIDTRNITPDVHRAGVPVMRSVKGDTPTLGDAEWLIASSVPAVWALLMLGQVLSTNLTVTALYVFTGIASTTWLFGLVQYWRARRKPLVHHRHALAIATLAGVVAVLLLSDNLGSSAAAYLTRHGEVPAILHSSIPTLALSGDCVTIKPIGTLASSNVTLPPAAVYLGEANGVVVLYAIQFDATVVSNERPIRLPAAQVVLVGSSPVFCTHI